MGLVQLGDRTASFINNLSLVTIGTWAAFNRNYH